MSNFTDSYDFTVDSVLAPQTSNGLPVQPAPEQPQRFGGGFGIGQSLHSLSQRISERNKQNGEEGIEGVRRQALETFGLRRQILTEDREAFGEVDDRFDASRTSRRTDAGLQLGAQRFTAEAEQQAARLAAERQIAELNANTQLGIAGIDQQTQFGVADRQGRAQLGVAGINAGSNRDVANINARAEREVALINALQRGNSDRLSFAANTQTAIANILR